MMKKIFKRGLVIFVIIAITSFFNFYNLNDLNAADLINASDHMSELMPANDSNHTIAFNTPSGVHAPAATITITFDTGFDPTAVTFADMDISHGAVTGYETEETLAAVAGVNIWGASFTGNVLTLAPPTNAGVNEIPPNNVVVIEIGTIASGGVNAINNPVIEGVYPVLIAGGFGDTSNMGVIVDDTTVGITAQVAGGGAAGGDVSPPVIFNVQVINITPFSSTVTWQTNETANSRVNYGETIGYEIATVFDGAYVSFHSLDLAGLTPDTLYHFQVISFDPSGNMAVAGDFTFTTLPLAEELIIFNVRAENIAAHSADIVWETNRDADSRTDYGLTDTYEIGFFSDPAMTLMHSVPLAGLLADTTYYFSVTSTDGLGNTVTSIGHSFTTLPEFLFVPNVNNFLADPDIDNVRVILTWQNPIIPDLGGVLIKRSTTAYPATPFDGDFVYNGPGELAFDTNVEFGQIYYYSAFAYNLNGDFASGAFDWAILIPDYTVHIKGWPEKRFPRTGNWDVNAGLFFRNAGSPVITNLYSVDTDEMGEADVLVDDLLPGVYDVSFKGLSHLNKLLFNIDVDPVSNTFIDFTEAETFDVLAGDVHLSKDNYVNGLDISATVIVLYTNDLHADLNQDTQVNGLDLSILVYNLYKWGD